MLIDNSRHPLLESVKVRLEGVSIGESQASMCPETNHMSSWFSVVKLSQPIIYRMGGNLIVKSSLVMLECPSCVLE